MITPRGDIHCPIWAILYEPSEQDNANGKPISGSEGFHFDKMLSDVGLPYDTYITTVQDNFLYQGATPEDNLRSILDTCNYHHPSIVLLIGSRISELVCPETRNYKKPHDCKMDKWAGSLLVSPSLNYPHYCIPLWQPSYIFADWSYRDIYCSIDLGKAKDEYDYLSNNGTLMPLPTYNIITNPPYHQLLDFLNTCRGQEYVGSDIETIRPARSTVLYKGHPGYFYTIALSLNEKEACSFCLWDYSRTETTEIWTNLEYILRHVRQIGQNYIQFDTHHQEALGFSPDNSKVIDTRIRHHILWPEMPHSLQFMTKQYTRQKYYKDEGKTWKPSQKVQLLVYNAMDTLVLHPIYQGQENEFRDRPYLR